MENELKDDECCEAGVECVKLDCKLLLDCTADRLKDNNVDAR